MYLISANKITYLCIVNWLFINSISGSEIIVVLLFILIFFGSKSIPGFSRSLGRGLRQIRNASQEVQNEIRKSTSEMTNEMKVNRSINQVRQTVEQPFQEAIKKVEKSTKAILADYEIKDGVPRDALPKSVPPKQETSEKQDDQNNKSKD